MHWIEREAERIKFQETQQAEMRQYELLAARSLDAKIPQLWESIYELSQDAVSRWNARFKGESAKKLEFIADPLSAFRIRKPQFPVVTVAVVLEIDARAIRIDKAETYSSNDRTHESSHGRIDFLYEDSQVCVRHGQQTITLDECVQYLMEPVLDAF